MFASWGDDGSSPSAGYRPAARHILVDRDRVVTQYEGKYPVLPQQLPQVDGSWMWIRKENEDVHRNTRQDAGELLRDAFDKGGYASKSGGRTPTVKFKGLQKMLDGTKVLRHSETLPELPASPNHTFYTEYGGSAIDQAVKLQLQGYRVATVNAASAYHAGGGFTTGGRHALEEAFCSQTTLYPSLKKVLDASGPSHHGRHHAHIPEDGVILSPNVEIFRKGSDQGYQLLGQPVEVSGVISMAMYNRNAKVGDAPCDAPLDPAAYAEGVRQKFTMLFHAAALSGADCVIVPDVGCGVFQNDPCEVGKICGKVLTRYAGYFRLALFTGKQDFYEAAFEGMRPPKLTRALKRENPCKPRSTCFVCGKPLGRDLAVLLGPTGEQATTEDDGGIPLQFLHGSCSEKLAEDWPGYSAMGLPDAARDADSFLKAIDVDSSGTIEKEELRCVVAALWTGDPSKMDAEFEAKWATWDQDSSGSLDIDEVKSSQASKPTLKRGFAGDSLRVSVDSLPRGMLDWVQLQALSASDALKSKVMSEVAHSSQQKLVETFQKWDRDSTGFIEKEDLQQLMMKLDAYATKESVQSLLQEADVNADGKISYQEFTRWVTEYEETHAS
eukprot:TRINITY_DN19662_c0_g1_i2.p1 TRINITY_DN19662_c0_g1~~TRINITY_DN19662_c0_g1_i2.p1  ORF type:complete len:621 (+),score=112.39 TRINITY_DN19662_c0_g1_i2:31-1863(+)